MVSLSFSGAVFIGQPCKGDPSLPVVPQPIAWISGPATVGLGRMAELRVPSGYSFANEKSARAFLDGMRVSPPKGIVGVLQPNSGAWWATMDFTPRGYVKDEDKEQIDPDALLMKLSEEVNRQQSKPQSVTWERKPDYDATQHSLEWAVRVTSEQNESVIRQTLRLLGRHGVIDVIVNRPARERADLTPLKDALKDVSFKEGERYAEYRPGDKIAPGGLAGQVTLIKEVAPTDTEKPRVEAAGMKTFWIGIAAVFCVGFVGMVVVVKKIKNSRTLAPVMEAAKEIAFPPQPVARPVQAVAPKPAPVVAVPKPVNGTKPHHVEKPKPVVKTNGHHHNKTKRKVFNYQKFYTEMVLSGPAPTLAVEANGYELELNRMAGHTTPPDNHHHQNGKHDSSAAVTVNSELIANQRSIIEEQKRLIQEQAKLIDEKTRLISEKNQLLQRQSEMIANNLL